MNRDKIVKKYLGPQEGQEVTYYLDKIGFRKKFRPEERFFKAVEREMISECEKSPIFQKASENDDELVKTWRSFIGVFVENELRARTVLNVIRLLNGNRNIHDFSYEELVGEDPDADLDEFFMDKDQQREEWYY